MPTIYRKTDKAQAEIETRAYRLVPRLRTALILVDGKRNSDELGKMIGLQPEEVLATLREQGFIEAVSEVTVTMAPLERPRLVPAAPAAVPAQVAKAFEQTRRDAVRAFTDVVGPMAEALAIKMEKARSGDELRPLLETARQIINNSRGAAAAEQFAARFLASFVPLAA